MSTAPRGKRSKKLIASFVEEMVMYGDKEGVKPFAEGWAFKVNKSFKTSLDIRETQMMVNKKKTMQWTQGSNYNFEIGDIFHNNILAHRDWNKYIEADPTTLQVSFISNNLLNIEVYKKDVDKKNALKVVDHIFATDKHFVDILKYGIGVKETIEVTPDNYTVRITYSNAEGIRSERSVLVNKLEDDRFHGYDSRDKMNKTFLYERVAEAFDCKTGELILSLETFLHSL